MKYIRTNCTAYHPVGTLKHDNAQKELKAGEQVSIEYKNDYIKLFQGDLYIGFITDTELLVDNEEEIEYVQEEMKYKTCTKCKKNLPLIAYSEDYNRNGRSLYNRSSICKQCTRVYYTETRKPRDRRYQ